MEFGESDDEILPEARVFEFRAQNIFQSKLEAIKELMNKAPEELEGSDEEEEGSKKQRKPRGRKQKKEKSSDQVEEAKPKKTRKKKIVEEDQGYSPPMRNRRAGTPIFESDDDSPPKRSRREGTPEADWYASPEKPRGGRRKKAPVNKDKGSADSEELISYVNLPAASKRKIKELKLKSSRLQRRIDMENELILSAFDAAEVVEESSEDVDLEQSITLKIRLMSDVSKMTVKLGEMFSSIYNKVAFMHNLQASEILLCVRDQTIKLTDTPLSLNLKYFEMIDCLPYKPTHDKLGDFLLKMQSNDTRKKVDVYGSKLEKFEGFMKRYSEMRDIPMDKLSFEFDGEKINGSETPEELEIESGSCIDVNVVKENSVPAICINGDIEITAEIISPSNRIEILELD